MPMSYHHELGGLYHTLVDLELDLEDYPEFSGLLSLTSDPRQPSILAYLSIACHGYGTHNLIYRRMEF